MDIYAKEGTMVRYNYESYQGIATNLELMKCYTIELTDVGNSYTSVYLKEFPGIPFNSVCFENIPQMPNEYSHLIKE